MAEESDQKDKVVMDELQKPVDEYNISLEQESPAPLIRGGGAVMTLLECLKESPIFEK